MKIAQSLIELAKTKITDDMLVRDAKKIQTAQQKLNKQLEHAAYAYIKETENRDLIAERPHWKRDVVSVTGTGVRGTVTVQQYLCDERAPDMLSDTWRINKSTLLRKYS